MPSQLRVRWDGDVPGISERRLSLNAFGDAMAQLLVALRRIATQMVSNAMGNEQPKTGRFANIARQIDIEITTLEYNSTGFDSVVTFAQPPEELPLFADIPDRAVAELLDSIEREAKGQLTNQAVRKYLSLLPSGVHRQAYELHSNGTSRKRIELGDLKIADVPTDLPILRKMDGSIVGVGFDPGKSEVRIKTQNATQTLAATPETVELALDIRHEQIRTLSVHVGSRARIISLNRATDKPFEFTKEAAEQHIFTRWQEVFAALAK